MCLFNMINTVEVVRIINISFFFFFLTSVLKNTYVKCKIVGFTLLLSLNNKFYSGNSFPE